MAKVFLLGILVAMGYVQTLSAQACQLQAGAIQGMGQLVKTTGNPMVDVSLNSELSALYQAFQVHPSFFILNDAQASNAFAMPDTLQLGTTGTVAFGYHLMDEEFRRSGPVNFSISAIMAHEFSHIVQFQRGSRLGVTQRELQADYMAGWYIGKRQTGAIAPGSLENSLRSFYEHGTYNFNDPQFHGTPEQRASSVMNGFRNSNVSLSAAYRTSESLVQQSGSGSDDPANDSGKGGYQGGGSDRSPARRSELTRVLALAERNALQDLKGERSTESWDATVKLPFAKHCEVEKEPHGATSYLYLYECAIATHLDADNAREQSDNVVKILLDQVPGIKHQEPRDQRGRHTEFFETLKGAYINVRTFPARNEYAVWIDIAPPQAE